MCGSWPRSRSTRLSSGLASARRCHACATAGRTRSTVGGGSRARRPGSRAAEHHRSRDRRSADRRTKTSGCASSPTASSTTSSGFATELEQRGPRLPHAVRQRDRAASLRGSRAPRPVHALRGEFAFAIWDERDGTLFAARDRFGIKPLYYTRPRRRLLPRLRGQGARRRSGCPLAWDRETLYDVHFVSHPPDRIALRRHLPTAAGQLPGRPTASTCSIVPYWDWDYPPADDADRPSDPTRVHRAAARTRSRKRCGCGCAPTCRSPAISAAASTRAPCSGLHRGCRRGRCAPTRSRSITPTTTKAARGGAGRAVRRGVLPHRHPLGAPRRSFRRRALSRRAAVRQRALRREVSAEPRGARRRASRSC